MNKLNSIGPNNGVIGNFDEIKRKGLFVNNIQF